MRVSSHIRSRYSDKLMSERASEPYVGLYHHREQKFTYAFGWLRTSDVYEKCKQVIRYPGGISSSMT